uniref:Carboxypeptidase regulatory-like domain-containing protein n=1 Tax=uncultured myxobacterium HF0200_08J13 TaxID=723558 RepID=E7C3Q4_9BACT|nr:hypothetical protein [uncultured myxobacterium HF0200_08J13]
MHAYFSKTVVLVLIAGVGLIGCGGGDTGPVTHSVKGKLTKGGEPLANVSITFAAASGGEGGADTDAQGMYETVVPAGTYKIVLAMAALGSADTGSADTGSADDGPVGDVDVAEDDIDTSDPMAMEASFPETWTAYETSPKEFTVVEGENTIDIEIE